MTYVMGKMNEDDVSTDNFKFSIGNLLVNYLIHPSEVHIM